MPEEGRAWRQTVGDLRRVLSAPTPPLLGSGPWDWMELKDGGDAEGQEESLGREGTQPFLTLADTGQGVSLLTRMETRMENALPGTPLGAQEGLASALGSHQH